MAEQDGGFAAQDPFEAFRRLWGPLGLPVPGMAMPTLDPAELEKRIADLKSVETWLGMNLNMVKMAIQGLEVQKMALDAMKTNAGAAGDAASAFADFSRTMAGAAGSVGGGSGASAANPLLWPWAMMQGATGAPAAGKPAAKEDAPEPKTKESGSK